MGILPHTHKSFPHRSLPCEREVLLTIADDEQSWTVFTDSARLARHLLRLAGRWGVKPEPRGAGWEFILPLKAIRFREPREVSTAQRRALIRARFQKARNGAGEPVEIEPAEGPRHEADQPSPRAVSLP